MQVPDDANLMAQIFLGSSSSWGMGVLVNTWSGDLPGNGEKKPYGTVTLAQLVRSKITLLDRARFRRV